MIAILLRSTIVFLLSLAVLVYLEARAYRLKETVKSLSAGIFLVLFVLAYRISSAYMGASFLVSLGLPGRWGVAPGLFLGLWSSAILLQYLQNRLRLRYGQRLEKIRWFALRSKSVRKS
jgi:hypothetical protein